MNSGQVKRAVVCAAIIALCVAGAGLFPAQSVAGQEIKTHTRMNRSQDGQAQSVAGQETKPAALYGASAIEQLKQDSQYGSLQMAMNQARFSVSRADNTPLGRSAWHAPNPAAGYNAYVTEAGVSIALNDKSHVSLNLHSLGYGNALRTVAPGEVSGDKQIINLTRDGGVREWYVNGPEGLEQGFTLAEPPGMQQAGVPLRLALQVSEGWRAKAREDGQQVTLSNADGQAVEYSKLVVIDSLGHNIPARLKVVKKQVFIEVEDSEATYPLTIDPVFNLQQKLVAEDGEYSAHFGSAVALDGDTLVVGAMYDDDGAGVDENLGSAYIFTRSGGVWTLQQKLTASDGEMYDFFGTAVAVSGDTVMIGAPGNTNTVSDQGSVYVFTRSNGAWTYQQKLNALDAGDFDRLGESLALDGDTAVAGARYDDIGTADLSDDRGAAYVFTRSGGVWTQQQKLTASDGARSDMFGHRVTVSGDTVAVGMPFDNIGSEFDRGSAYVFTRSGSVWTQQQKITAIDGDTFHKFGSSVSLDGDTLAVGAESDISIHAQGGSAYIFKRNGTVWTQQQKLRGSDSGLTDLFGNQVALEGDTLLIGVANHNVGASSDQGAAYIFKHNGTTWAEQQKLTASDGAENDHFGWGVALNGNTVVVGAALDDIDEIARQGSVYIFNLSSCPITITPASLANGFIDFSYEQQMAASGGTGPYQFALAGGTLPTGVSLSSSGLLSGTTTTAGTYQFTISVTDLGGGCSASLTYTVRVRACPELVIPSEIMPGNLNRFYNEPLFVQTGMGPYTFVALGGIPPGLSLSAEGLLSGTPTELGQYNISVLITDVNGCSNEASVLITILPEPIDCFTLTLAPESLSNGLTGNPYQQQLTVNGTPEPFQFALFDGTLPPGISLSPSGLLSGMPTATGTYNFIILANDLNNFCFLGGAYTITIESCSIITLDLPYLSTGMVSEPYSETLTATGGVAPYTFIASSGLPPGLSLSANGLLSGTPTADGIFNLRVVITDARGCTSKDSISIVILTKGIELPDTSRAKRGSQ